MNQRVSELFEVIRKAEAELSEIRRDCKHSTYYCGMWSWRVGAYHPSRICADCQIAINGITEEEAKKVFDEFNKPYPTSGSSHT